MRCYASDLIILSRRSFFFSVAYTNISKKCPRAQGISILLLSISFSSGGQDENTGHKLIISYLRT